MLKAFRLVQQGLTAAVGPLSAVASAGSLFRGRSSGSLFNVGFNVRMPDLTSMAQHLRAGAESLSMANTQHNINVESATLDKASLNFKEAAEALSRTQHTTDLVVKLEGLHEAFRLYELTLPLVKKFGEEVPDSVRQISSDMKMVAETLAHADVSVRTPDITSATQQLHSISSDWVTLIDENVWWIRGSFLLLCAAAVMSVLSSVEKYLRHLHQF